MKTLLLAAILSSLATASLAGADLSITYDFSADSSLAGGTRNTIQFFIRNSGPDEAKNVVFTLTSAVGTVIAACAKGCAAGNNGTVPVGTQLFRTDVDVPDTVGTVRLAASVTSSTPDPNLNNNNTTTTFRITPNAADIVRLGAPLLADLAFPFPLTVNVQPSAAVHDVDTTIEFRSDVDVKTLPEGCTNPAAGRVVCHSDAIAAGKPPSFVITLFAPRSYGGGYVDFTATATERPAGVAPTTSTTRNRTQLWFTIYVTTTTDSGAGSLRQAILDANASSESPLAIGFRIGEASTTPWKTIRVTSPLPVITASALRIDGAMQAGFFGDANPDGPEIEISGGGTVDGHGLHLAACGAEVANLAIGGFLANGISVAAPSSVCTSFYTTELHDLFIGTDPTGSSARPNARGIGTSVPNGNDFNSAGAATDIDKCVISGNTFSGIFGMSGRLNISNDRIGVKAHADEPLPNGNSGVFIGTGGYGSDVGANVLSIASNPPDFDGNVIAFNGQMGVAVAAGVADVAIRNNRIWGNALLGIDIGLDGPTQTSGGIPMPSLTLAHYDPVIGKTVIEGDVGNSATNIFSVAIDFFANDAPDPAGLGEGQRPLGNTGVTGTLPSHFRFTVDGNLTGQFISATATRNRFVGFAKPEGIEQGFLTQTSEFSPVIEVR
jgi:hypothetical protein